MAITDKIAISAQADLGHFALGIGGAAIGAHALTGAAELIWRTIPVSCALQRAADALALDAALAERAVQVVKALRLGTRDADLVDAHLSLRTIPVPQTLRISHTFQIHAGVAGRTMAVFFTRYLLTKGVDADA